jgi:hypothetical protein
MTSSQQEQVQPDRRGVLRGAVTAGLAAVLDPVAEALRGAAPPQRSLIRAENDVGIHGFCSRSGGS